MTRFSLDLFCRVVDNYGDVGVCWRLAQCLERDQGCAVRLFVDDFSAFKRIEPALDPSAPIQTLRNISILRWNDDLIAQYYTDPSDAVIEAFACTLPEIVTAAMSAAKTPPVWMDLEYLSAEEWVDTHHAIPSPHPMTGLIKTLFFPGFTPRTGGLIREKGLLESRCAFQSSTAAQNAWRVRYNLPLLSPAHLDISLFCYNDAPLQALISLLETGLRPARLFIPADPGAADFWTNLPLQHTTLHSVPFLPSAEYDRLLWTSDVNIVRGEDSFVRAQWAARPMLWHIYPQQEDHHFIKLKAFLSRYCTNLDPECTDLLENFMVLWNERGRDTTGPMERIGPGWLDRLPALTAHAVNWADHLARQDDLATQLVRFIRQQKNAKTQKDTQR